MTSVGVQLRTERERQGRETAEIAEELCITQRYLRAIEQDDLQSLPGSFFYKSFVKQYAAVLGVDQGLLQAGVDSLVATVDPAPPPKPEFTELGRMNPLSTDRPVRDLDPIVQDGNRRYFPDRRIGLSLVTLVGMVLMTSGIYGWYNGWPARSSHRVSRPEPRIEGTVVTPVKAETPVAGAAIAAPSIDVTTTTGADGVSRVVLTLSATEKTWLSITSDGKPIFSGILEPTQTKTLRGLEVAKMRVGNAGGLEVRWNGKPIGPIGPRGQVRVVLFTPENFQILGPAQTI